MGVESVDAGGRQGGESVDAGHCLDPVDDQREPLPEPRVSLREVRGSHEAEDSGGPVDAAGRQVLSLVRRQVCGAVAPPSHDAFCQQVAQGSVDRRVRLAEDARQLRRVDERRPAEGVQQLLVGEAHVLSVTE